MGNRREEDRKKRWQCLALFSVQRLFCVTPVSIRLLPVGTASVSIDKAEARVGRPRTPTGYAGVTRRDASAAVLMCPQRQGGAAAAAALTSIEAERRTVRN